MLPHLGPLPFPTTYGLLVALGLVVALVVLRRLAPRAGLPVQATRDVAVWACLAGLVGAKLLLVVIEPATFLARPWEVLFQGGVFYGGVIAAGATAYALARHRGLDPHAFGDACAPALALGHAFGRLGCFLAGCCWGRACDLPWGVVYTDPDAAATQAVLPAGSPVHPVQLYEAGANLLLAALLLAVFGRRRFVGQVWWVYVGAYALVRLGLEEFRGDPRGDWLGGALSTSQLVALGAIAAAGALLVLRSRGARRSRAEGDAVAQEAAEPTA